MYQVVATQRFKTIENLKTINQNSGHGCLQEIPALAI